MDVKENKYVSMFRIDGMPILPPLMTDDKRREMLIIKAKVLRLERALEEVRRSKLASKDVLPSKPEKFNKTATNDDNSDSVTEDEYLKVSNMMKNNSDDTIVEEISLPNPLDCLKKSETFIYDVINNTVTVPEQCACPMDLSIASDTTEDCSTLVTSSVTIPSIEIFPPTPIAPAKTFLQPVEALSPNKAPQRSATSPSLKAESSADSPLIRSNSFTLEGPSNVLLEHFKNQKSVSNRKAVKTSGRVTRDTVESKAKKVKKSESKSKLETVAQRCAKSPYESRLTKKVLRKHKTPTATPKPTESPTFLKDIESQHRKRMLELLHQQREEQKRLQDSFALQQKELLEQLNADMTKIQISDPDSPVSSKSSLISEPNCSEIPRSTPRRRLFSKEQSPLTSDRGDSAQRRKQAATIITAYARGYLVRRLFNTSHVQRIVQTIRDTLIFAVEFHMETRYDDSEDNLKFKARLLQQLSSAIDHLRNVFSASVADRMAIITRDRDLIRTKTTNLNSARSDSRTYRVPGNQIKLQF